MNISTVIALFGAAFALAVLLEGAVEYLIGTPMDQSEKAKKWKWLLIYPSMILGILICLYYGLDLIVLIVYVLSKLAGGEVVWNVTWVGMILSGILIGRGSNYLHDFLVKVLVLPPVPLAKTVNYKDHFMDVLTRESPVDTKVR